MLVEGSASCNRRADDLAAAETVSYVARRVIGIRGGAHAAGGIQGPRALRRAQQKATCEMVPKLKGRCWKCGKVWPQEELSDIDDLWGRVLAGDEMPLGQCPDPQCGMLCYLVREPHRIIVTANGGLVRDVSGIPRATVVEVRDFEVERTHGEIHKTPEGREYVRTLWESKARP